jgi:hypothetical protein
MDGTPRQLATTHGLNFLYTHITRAIRVRVVNSENQPKVYVEQWPSGGWAVRLAGHPVPVSRHDTEEEALERASAYEAGLERERLDRLYRREQ